MQRNISEQGATCWKEAIHMRTPSQTATQDRLRRLRLDVDAHHRQMGGMWSADPDMLRLLKVEEAMLTREIARLEMDLEAPGR